MNEPATARGTVPERSGPCVVVRLPFVRQCMRQHAGASVLSETQADRRLTSGRFTAEERVDRHGIGRSHVFVLPAV